MAWGIVDAAMHILTQLVARKRQRNFAVEIADTSAHEARKMILERLPGGLEGHLSTEELDPLVKAVRSLPLPSPTYLPNREDLLGAVAIFLLVFLSTVPIALPFLLIGNVAVALRTSNAIAVALLFLVGMRLGRYMELSSPWIAGLGVALFGAILVAITIALGG